jgi:hypothetical protein
VVFPMILTLIFTILFLGARWSFGLMEDLSKIILITISAEIAVGLILFGFYIPIAIVNAVGSSKTG